MFSTSTLSRRILSAGLLTAAVLCAQSAIKSHSDYGSIPLYFEENRGQTSAQARYIGRAANLVAFLTGDGWTLSSGGDGVSMHVLEAASEVRMEAEGAVEGITNYYLGSRAITGLPHYAGVRARGIRPGIDMLYHGHNRELEYDFVLHPGADPGAIRLRFEAASRPALDKNGDLVFKTKAGNLLQRKPRVWQEAGGQRREVECHYVLTRSGEVRLALAKYDRSAELVIDPVISYSTFLGGTNTDVPLGIAADGGGNAYVTGYTFSSDFPVTFGAIHSSFNFDAFVTKLNPSGAGLMYSTFIGGFNSDLASGIALDNAGNAYITGYTLSNDFPFTNNHYAGGLDAFVVKLGPTGNLVYATALGGFNDEAGNAIAVDASGSAFVAGYTFSTNFPVTNGSFQTIGAGNRDGFVAKLTPTGQISYATYLGGAGDDFAAAIAVDASGNAFVGGTTSSNNFPVTAGAYSTVFAGFQDAFVAKLNPAGSALVYATYLGGSSYASLTGLALDAAGNAYATGSTQSTDFPTTPGAFSTVKPSSSPLNSAFVSKLNPTGTSLVYSTFLGGSNNDSATAIALDLNGSAYVAGATQSVNFPITPGSLRTRTLCCDNDFFIVKLSSDGSTLPYATLLGSSGNETATGLALDGSGGVYVVGYAFGLNYPTTSSAFQPSNPKTLAQSNNASTGVVTKIDFNSLTVCNPSVSPSSASVPGRGGPVSFNLLLAAGCPWEATADSFITLNPPTHGVAAAAPIAMSATVALNQSISSGRTGSIRIGAATFTVNQSAGSCQDPIISPMSEAFDSNGGLRDISLVLPSACVWQAVSSAPWLIVTANASGSGPATVTIFAGQNSFSPRSATLTIAGMPIPITQSGSTCTATAASMPSSFPAQGGTGFVQITTSSSNCIWTAYNVVPWIQFGPLTGNGQGSGGVPFVVGANPGALARSAQILIADQTVMITQAAGPTGAVGGYTPSTFAGGGSSSTPNLGDGGPALSAYLNFPRGLAFDPATGILYIVDANVARLRAVTPNGNINTIAGGGTGTGENIPAISAVLFSGNYVALDNLSNIYLDDNLSRVREISQGNIATFAGTATAGFGGDMGSAASAQLRTPLGIAADSSGNVYISDATNNRVRVVNGGNINTFAGGGSSGLGDNGPATSAQLSSPAGLAVDPGGNVYLADTNNSRIRKVSQGTITTFAGGGAGGDGGPATGASLSLPTAVALDPLGQVFFIDGSSSRIRRVLLDHTISTIFSSGFSLQGLAADPSGNIYVSDASAGLVRKLAPIPAFCNYSVPASVSLPAAGSGVGIPVMAAAGCNWTALSEVPWIMVTSGASGTGNGTVNLSVAANSSFSPRSGTIAVAGQAIPVTQAGIAALSISKTHSGNFVQGQIGRYTVTVSNAPNAGATFGTVTMTESVPPGMMLQAMSGTGWMCSATTCTRSDALASGSSYPPITVTVAVAPNATSPQMNQVSVSGGGSGTANASDSTIVLAGPAMPLSVTPNAGSGSSQTFAFVFSDPSGALSISSAGVDVGSLMSQTASCYVYFARMSNQVFLADDAGVLRTGLAVGSPGTAGNSQCMLDAGASSVMLSGNTLTLNLALTFRPAYAGAKNIFMEVFNGLDSGWAQRGTWTVPATSLPDFALSMTPGTETVVKGSSASYTVTVTPFNGFSGVVNFSVAMLPPGTTGAFVPTIVTGSGSTTLTINTAGLNAGNFTVTVTGTSGGLSHSASATLSVTNTSPPSAISVSPNAGGGVFQTFAFSFADPLGASNIVSVSIDIGAMLSPPGSCYVYYARAANLVYLADDAGIFHTGLPIGFSGSAFNTQCTLNAGSSFVNLSGNTLTLNLALSFNAQFAGLKGIFMEAFNGLDSGWVQKGTWTVVFNSAPDFSLSIAPGTQSVVKGGSASYTVTVTPLNGFASGVNFVVSGLPAGASAFFFPGTVFGSGATTLTVNTSAAGGVGSFPLMVVGTSGSLNHTTSTTLTVTNTSPPSAVSVTPNSGSGASQTFAFTFSDPLGAANILSTSIDVGFSLSQSVSCYVYYAQGSNQLFLADDGGAFHGGLTVGVAGTSSNNQCTLDAGASSVMLSGNTLTLNLALSFKPAFGGAKKIFMEAFNGLDSGFVQRGNWTSP